MEEIIKTFIDNKEEKKVNINMAPIDDMIKIFNKFGYKRGDIDTNSWSVDFWIPLKNNDDIILLGGSWYYGKYSLSRDVDGNYDYDEEQFEMYD